MKKKNSGVDPQLPITVHPLRLDLHPRHYAHAIPGPLSTKLPVS
jgi:hypothetical protein